MTVAVAVEFLRATARTLGEDALLLTGIDRIKDAKRLVAAYDDARGVTAQFNLNLLHRINRDLQATIPVSAFCHVARWNDYEARIEMHLEAGRYVEFTVAGQSFAIPREKLFIQRTASNMGRERLAPCSAQGDGTRLPIGLT